MPTTTTTKKAETTTDPEDEFTTDGLNENEDENNDTIPNTTESRKLL